MKRLATTLLLLCALIALPSEVSAQLDLSKALNSFFSSSQQKRTPYDEIAESAPEQRALYGKWTARDLRIEYLGNNSLTKYAVSEIESYLKSQYDVRSLLEVGAYLNISRNGTGVITYDEHKREGCYTYDASKGALIITTVVDGREISCNGYVRLSDVGVLTLLLDVNSALQSFKSNFPEYANDSTFRMAESTFSSLSDVYVSILLRKS